MSNDMGIEHWACEKAQEIVLREGFNLIRSAREHNNVEIRQHSLMLARAIAATLVEASVSRDGSADDGVLEVSASTRQ
ncbi:hypothetical protein [Sinorhizobium sp. BG8]|uniref:hypothetical protein n=1 Tax=Sinorhizobium sp. BG8 TaxID=2613773 RepID=UPI00193E14E3|nr:hypothetical protein [Sinorhizobium sp. BG8]QRM54451.1 hypothetical protein F3Y30_07755 [Sinorhizobium sp. BG8]